MYGDMQSRFEKGRRKMRILQILVVVGILLIGLVALCFRFDFAEGSHKIIPTAVDTDFFGNYKVYYKTSALTQNIEESVYYVSKDNPEIAEQIREALLENKEIVVYYGKMFGFYGFNAPREAPIYKVEFVE